MIPPPSKRRRQWKKAPRASVVDLASNLVAEARRNRNDADVAQMFAVAIEQAIRKAVSNAQSVADQRIVRAEQQVAACVRAQEDAEMALWELQRKRR